MLRSGMSLALLQIEEDRKDFQASVSQTLSPDGTSRPFNFPTINYLVQSLSDAIVGSNSRFYVAAFDALRDYG
jgi:hypothetical protein